MPKRFIVFFMAVILVLGGAGCVKESMAPSGENQNINQSVNEESSGSSEKIITPEESEEPSKTGGVKFASYTNKTLGYTINRPDGWFWRHYIQREIGENQPGIEDYFITDPNPLPRLESEYLGRIVIEVSRKSLEELAANVSDLTSSDATVGGAEAGKFEGTRDNEMVRNQKVIEYHFQKDGRTFRVIYVKPDSAFEEEAVFERLVSSLNFAK